MGTGTCVVGLCLKEEHTRPDFIVVGSGRAAPCSAPEREWEIQGSVHRSRNKRPRLHLDSAARRHGLHRRKSEGQLVPFIPNLTKVMATAGFTCRAVRCSAAPAPSTDDLQSRAADGGAQMGCLDGATRTFCRISRSSRAARLDRMSIAAGTAL
jgi:hypothetical protein